MVGTRAIIARKLLISQLIGKLVSNYPIWPNLVPTQTYTSVTSILGLYNETLFCISKNITSKTLTQYANLSLEP